MLSLTGEFVEEDSDKYTGLVQRGSATHVSHRDGAVNVLFELVDHVTHNLCTGDVRENGTKDLNLPYTSPKSSRDQNATLKTPVARRLHHQREKYSKASCFNVRIQRARGLLWPTSMCTCLSAKGERPSFSTGLFKRGLVLLRIWKRTSWKIMEIVQKATRN